MEHFTHCCVSLEINKGQIKSSNASDVIIIIIIHHIYIAPFWTLKALHIEGGISSTTTNVQHPPG